MLQIIKTVILSFILILLSQYLWNYIKDNYSVKKSKDLVGLHTQKYKSILNEYIENTKTKNDNFISEEQKMIMNNELERFLEQELSQPLMIADV